MSRTKNPRTLRMSVRPLFHVAVLLTCGLASAQAPLPAATLQAVDRRQVEVLNGGSARFRGHGRLRERTARDAGHLDARAEGRRAAGARVRVQPAGLRAQRRGGRRTRRPRRRRGAGPHAAGRRCCRRSVLVGHSMGGLYMQEFARAHPDEVKYRCRRSRLGLPGCHQAHGGLPAVCPRRQTPVLHQRQCNREIDGILAILHKQFDLTRRVEMAKERGGQR